MEEREREQIRVIAREECIHILDSILNGSIMHSTLLDDCRVTEESSDDIKRHRYCKPAKYSKEIQN